ncbi:hypothetical protein AAIB33_05130 [Microbacterium sp. AZCO]|uniref:hypothetical protein n=1 Tax=Microbacterium sp. AZCO TaxID=3142976 RepID=UPI0031F44FC2
MRAVRLIVGALMVVCLAGCTASPSREELAGADAARDGGLRTLGSIEVPTPAGYSAVAERTMDACGSLTSDRGGFDDTHVEGYSCALIRRTVYTANDDSARSDAGARAAVTQLQEAFGLDLSPNVPTAMGFFDADGLRVDMTALVRPAGEVDIDMLPLWHANQLVHSDDGELSGKLSDVGVDAATVLMVTTTVTYFHQLRSSLQP